MLLDFLGDVVCGGFGLPIARDMCQKVIVVGSNDLQSLYVANNVCSAVEYFRKLGGNVGVAGMVINKDDGTGEARAFAEAVGIPVLAAIPANEDIRRKSANYEIIGTARRRMGRRCSRNSPTTSPTAPPRAPDAARRRTACSACSSRAMSSAATWCWSRRASKTCAAARHRDQAVARSHLRQGLSCHGHGLNLMTALDEQVAERRQRWTRRRRGCLRA